MTAASHVLVIGSINEDLMVRVEQLPNDGETVLADSVERTPGGKGANQACAAAAHHPRVRLVGAVGVDPPGERQLAALLAAGVDTSAIDRRTTATTGMAIVEVDAHGENRIVVVPGANATLDADLGRRLGALLHPRSLVLLSLEIPFEAVSAVITAADQAGGVVLLNPSPFRALPRELLAAVDYLVVNLVEARTLLACSPHSPAELVVEQLGEAVMAGALPDVVVTLGAGGATWLSAQGPVTHRPPPIDVVDTTGAGDALAGAFAAWLAHDSEPGHALGRAVEFASEVVQVRGARPIPPSTSQGGRP